jgi:molybdopterin-guanine dinucleotide biosynthesis protein A
MGRDKASLPFGDEAMLQRVVRLVGEVVEWKRIVVVAAAGQLLPALPATVETIRDEREYQGPLLGTVRGMRALADRADAVHVTGCDVPLIVPALVSRMFELLGDHDAVVPVENAGRHPLAAVYRTRVLARIEDLAAAGERRMRRAIEAVDAREVSVDGLRDVDPQLLSLRNVNDEAEYRAALDATGLSGKQS